MKRHYLFATMFAVLGLVNQFGTGTHNMAVVLYGVAVIFIAKGMVSKG